MQVPFFWRGEVTCGTFPTLGTGTVNSPLAEATALGKQQVCMELTLSGPFPLVIWLSSETDTAPFLEVWVEDELLPLGDL